MTNGGKEQYVEMKRKDLHDIEFWRSMAEAMVGSNAAVPTQPRNVMAMAGKYNFYFLPANSWRCISHFPPFSYSGQNLLHLTRRSPQVKRDFNNNPATANGYGNLPQTGNYVLVKLAKSGLVIKVNHEDLAAFANDGSGGLNGTGHFVYYEHHQGEPTYIVTPVQENVGDLDQQQQQQGGETAMYVLPENYTVIGEATIERHGS